MQEAYTYATGPKLSSNLCIKECRLATDSMIAPSDRDCLSKQLTLAALKLGQPLKRCTNVNARRPRYFSSRPLHA